jgi:hypothetical protein
MIYTSIVIYNWLNHLYEGKLRKSYKDDLVADIDELRSKSDKMVRGSIFAQNKN